MKAALVLGFVRLCARLPLPVNHALGALLGWLAWALPNQARRVSLVNVALCFPELESAARLRLARRSLMEAGKTLTELGPMWHWPPERLEALVRETVDDRLLFEGYRAGKGVIALIPHLGCWEICNLYYARRVPLTILYRPPRMHELDVPVQRWRARAGARPASTSRAGVKSLFRALASGEVVGILPDQDPGAGAGVFAPFFGHPARTMTLISRLAQRSGARVVTVYGQRLPRGRGYRLRYRLVDNDIYATDLETSVAALNRAVEHCVRECPEQYQWSYKRFKAAPPGYDSPYRRHQDEAATADMQAEDSLTPGDSHANNKHR